MILNIIQSRSSRFADERSISLQKGVLVLLIASPFRTCFPHKLMVGSASNDAHLQKLRMNRSKSRRISTHSECSRPQWQECIQGPFIRDTRLGELVAYVSNWSVHK